MFNLRHLTCIANVHRCLTVFDKSIAANTGITHSAKVSCRKLVTSPPMFATDARGLFPFKTDNYGGIHFNITNESDHTITAIDKKQFALLVQNELRKHEENKLRSFWFRISTEYVQYIEPLVKLGFEFHHTKNNYVVLVKSLASTNNIPKYAYTNVGVGGLVVNENDEILVIKEKHFLVKQAWKLPGGYAEQGEELGSAAMREVFEETGIRTEFECLLMMRHVHRFAFDCADMYFVCLLKPLSNQITNCEHEIEQSQWANIHQIRDQMTNFNRLVLDKYLEWKKSPTAIRTETLDPNFGKMQRYTVYSMKKQNE